MIMPSTAVVVSAFMKVLSRPPKGVTLSAKEYCNLPKKYSTLDYLNLASSIVHNNGVTEGCKRYSNATYETYHRLIKQNGREDLRYNVNFILCIMNSNYGKVGHVKLEFIDINGDKAQYETTLPLQEISTYVAKNDAKWLTRFSKNNYEYKTEKKDLVLGRSVPNTRLGYPTLESLIYPGGFIRIYAETIYHDIKIRNR